MTGLYRHPGLDVYERVHYGAAEHVREVADILVWYRRSNTNVLDIGCSGGLHATEFAKRGFAVTGIDIEASAIERAKKRSQDALVDAAFYVFDIVQDSLDSLGPFDFVYSIGNVLSHIPKECAPQIFKKIKLCLDTGGIFFFDLLNIGQEFPEELREDDLGIVWQRRLNRKTGEISLKGIFPEHSLVEYFNVWGYEPEEATEMLAQSGFSDIMYSDRIDFSYLGTQYANPVCLRYRAHTKERL